MNEKIQSLELRLQQLEGTTERVDILNKLSREVCWTEPKRAMRLAEEAGALAERLNYELGRYVSLHSRGRAFVHLSELPKGLECLHQSLDYYIQHEDYRQVSVRQSLMVAYHRQGDAVQALAHLEPALEMAMAHEDRRRIAEILQSMGVVYHGLGDCGRALEYGFESLAVLKGSGEIRSQLYCYVLISAVYGQLGHYERALEFLKEGLALDAARYDTSAHAMLLNNVAFAYVCMGDHDNAVVHLHRSLEFLESIGDRYAQASAFHNLGVEYLRLEDYGQALHYLRKGLELSRAVGYPFQEAEIQLSIGELYMERSANELALVHLQDGLKLAESISARQLQSIGHRWISTAYERMKDFEPALRHYKQYAELEHELFGAQVQRELQSLQRRHELEQRRNDNSPAVQQREGVERALQEMRALNQALVLLTRQLVGQNQKRSELLALLSHELRNPIAAIHINVSFIRDVIARSASEDVLQGLEDIDESSRRLARLINELLDVSSLEAGYVKLLSQPFEMRTAVAEVLRECRAAARPKGISLELLPGEGSVYALADRATTARVIGELVSNSVKFSLSGTRVCVRVWMEETAACCEVRDEGPGLSEIDKKGLFHRFNRLSPAPTGGEPSSGLGLAIAKKLVEAMGGSISAWSELGVGAAFTVRLPVAAEVASVGLGAVAMERAADR